MNVFYTIWHYVVAGEPTIWAGIIGAVIGVLGAIVGGWIGGRVSGRLAVAAALKGARQAHLDTISRDDADAARRAVAFVQSIQAEAEGLWATLSANIFPAIDAIGVDKPMQGKFVISDDYFVVYRANAHQLGSIADSATQRSIVKAYIAAQSFVDTVRMNNHLVEKYEDAQRVATQMGGLNSSPLFMQIAHSALITFSHGVVSSRRELEIKVCEFFAATNGWLCARGVDPKSLPDFNAVRGQLRGLSGSASGGSPPDCPSPKG